MVSLVECFWSLQGEGPWVGVPTLFVRTAGCPLRCTYCDTVESYEARPDFEVRDLRGRTIVVLRNPVEAATLLQAEWAKPAGPGAWLSVTGGEPLLWPGFCRDLFVGARSRGFRTLLESAALDADALRQVLPHADHLSLDYKLPSTLGGDLLSRSRHAASHLECLEVATGAGVETSLKIVLTPGVGREELREALEQLRPFRGGLCLVLQPVTPCLDEGRPLDTDALLEWTEMALGMDFGIRVLPQVHKSLGLA